MKRKTIYFPLFFALIFICYSCFKSKFSDLSNWKGSYFYEEEPIEANAGYSMVMEWTLIIKEEQGNYQGIISIDGQQTYIRLLTDIKGNGEKIELRFNTFLDGNDYQQYKKGDVLLTLIKKQNKLVTKWRAIKPRLSENFEPQGNCFQLQKQ